MTKVVDDRSPTAKAMSKVSEIMAICLMMIVPALLGYLLDQRFSLGFLFTVIGLVFGMVGSTLQLMQLVSAMNRANERVGGAPTTEEEIQKEDDEATDKS